MPGLKQKDYLPLTAANATARPDYQRIQKGQSFSELLLPGIVSDQADLK